MSFVNEYVHWCFLGLVSTCLWTQWTQLAHDNAEPATWGGNIGRIFKKWMATTSNSKIIYCIYVDESIQTHNAWILLYFEVYIRTSSYTILCRTRVRWTGITQQLAHIILAIDKLASWLGKNSSFTYLWYIDTAILCSCFLFSWWVSVLWIGACIYCIIMCFKMNTFLKWNYKTLHH